MTDRLYDMPDTIELEWAEYRLVVRALEHAEALIESSQPGESPELERIQTALRLLLARIWPDLGTLDDGGSFEP